MRPLVSFAARPRTLEGNGPFSTPSPSTASSRAPLLIMNITRLLLVHPSRLLTTPVLPAREQETLTSASPPSPPPVPVGMASGASTRSRWSRRLSMMKSFSATTPTTGGTASNLSRNLYNIFAKIHTKVLNIENFAIIFTFSWNLMKCLKRFYDFVLSEN